MCSPWLGFRFIVLSIFSFCVLCVFLKFLIFALAPAPPSRTHFPLPTAIAAVGTWSPQDLSTHTHKHTRFIVSVFSCPCTRTPHTTSDLYLWGRTFIHPGRRALRRPPLCTAAGTHAPVALAQVQRQHSFYFCRPSSHLGAVFSHGVPSLFKRRRRRWRRRSDVVSRPPLIARVV